MESRGNFFQDKLFGSPLFPMPEPLFTQNGNKEEQPERRAVAERSSDTAFHRRGKAVIRSISRLPKAAPPGFALCRRTPKSAHIIICLSEKGYKQGLVPWVGMEWPHVTSCGRERKQRGEPEELEAETSRRASQHGGGAVDAALRMCVGEERGRSNTRRNVCKNGVKAGGGGRLSRGW
jgi:hypothetical protein